MSKHKENAGAETRCKHIKGWRKSGLSQIEYCRRNGVNHNTFSSWKRQQRENPETEYFVELPKQFPQPQQAEPLIEIRLDENFRLGLRFNINLFGFGGSKDAAGSR